MGDPVHHQVTVERRLPRAVRFLPWVVALLDAVVLATFVTALAPHPGWGSSGATPVISVLAGSLGALAINGCLALTGRRLHHYRNTLRSLGAGPTFSTRLMSTAAGVLIFAVSLVMYVRVKVGLARNPLGDVTSAASLLPAAFATICVVVHLSVVAVYALEKNASAPPARGAASPSQQQRRPSAPRGLGQPGARPQGSGTLTLPEAIAKGEMPSDGFPDRLPNHKRWRQQHQGSDRGSNHGPDGTDRGSRLLRWATALALPPWSFAVSVVAGGR
jgi:hypothetical protein